MADEITHELFTPHVNTFFRIHGEGEPLEVELLEVELRDERYMIEGMRRPFTLIFRGPRDRLVPEGNYKVESEAAGSFDLYVIPIITANTSAATIRGMKDQRG